MDPVPKVVWTRSSTSLIPGWQITVRATFNVVWLLLIGLVIGLLSGRLSDILTRIGSWSEYLKTRPAEARLRTLPSARPDNEHTSLLNHRSQIRRYVIDEHPHPPERQGGHGQTRERIQDSHHAESIAPLTRPNGSLGLRKGSEKSGRGWVSTSFASGLLLVLVIAVPFLAGSPVNDIGLAGRSDCGLWRLKSDHDIQDADRDRLFRAQKETRAAQYARDCYGSRSIVVPDRCNFFEHATIKYETSLNEQCPFRDKMFCGPSRLSAVRFTTNHIPATVLGINSNKPPTFLRETTCVPLNWTHIQTKYIKQLTSNDYPVTYLLGGTSNSNHTFEMYSDPFFWDSPSYTMNVRSATAFPEHDYWTPIPELEVEPGNVYYMTMMFISSGRIFYTRRYSNDPIFPADQYFDNGLYINSDRRARPLACIDRTEVCSNEGSCDHWWVDHKEHGVDYLLTRMALEKSSIFHAVEFRRASALVAQESIAGSLSLPLNDQQWIIESQSLFNASLARIQFDTYEIGTGDGSEKLSGAYERKDPDWAREKLCGNYRFRLTNQYANINVWAALGVFASIFIAWILGQEIYFWPLNMDERESGCFRGRWNEKGEWECEKWMVFDSLLYFVVVTFKKLCSWWKKPMSSGDTRISSRPRHLIYSEHTPSLPGLGQNMSSCRNSQGAEHVTSSTISSTSSRLRQPVSREIDPESSASEQGVSAILPDMLVSGEPVGSESVPDLLQSRRSTSLARSRASSVPRYIYY